ncbi:hypothetical protein [Erythrobacter aureus]|jgi:hypothetical protein|uniref:hypothetical protein n=1 Tax=Erythrobacter aureus TaxID=2182384 RepID=UPI000C5C05A6|nr:hypothetical protein [Actinomycetota bacterium]|tara:strand:+ start:70 stop:591 length:522 start_codon:yes stop_codon:yes gene_type:complete
MQSDSLQQFVKDAQEGWSGLNSDTVTRLTQALERLVANCGTEAWCRKIHEEKPETVELYRDEKWGFVLLAHTERKGLYRPPHDHGCGWVFYILQHGRNRIGTYRLVTDRQGHSSLVTRGDSTKHPGECSVYLPGDIHDTECMSDYIVQFRLTSSDFAKEKAEGRMTVFSSFRR